MSYDPDAYGPGKKISPEQAIEYAQHNWQKLMIMLMRRLGNDHIVLGAEDVRLLVELPESTGLGVKLDDEGIHLLVIGPKNWQPPVGTVTARNDH